MRGISKGNRKVLLASNYIEVTVDGCHNMRPDAKLFKVCERCLFRVPLNRALCKTCGSKNFLYHDGEDQQIPQATTNEVRAGVALSSAMT